MPELIQTFKALHKKSGDFEETESEGPTFDDIRRKALGIETSKDDVVSLQGPLAAEAGFGIGMGLGYSKG